MVKISTSTQSSPAFGHEGLLQATEWGTSIEFSAGGGLLPANPASDDICHKVVFSTHVCSGYAAQHGNLTHMGQGVGDWTLEQLLGRGPERFTRCQVSLETRQLIKEARQLSL